MDDQTHYTPPSYKQLEAMRQIATCPDGLPRRGFKCGAALTRDGLAARVGAAKTARYFLTDLGIEALEIERTGRRRWSPILRRWIPA